jgi:hypothetical protein
MVPEVIERLPLSITKQCPDYAALRKAIVGVSGTEPPGVALGHGHHAGADVGDVPLVDHAGLHDLAGERREQLDRHLATYTGPEASSWVFTTETGGNIRTSYYQMLRRALVRMGRPDIRPHDLRHTGMTLAAEAGASLAELKHRLGQSTTQAAEIYLHATADHGRRIAERMDELAREPSSVRPLRRRT